MLSGAHNYGTIFVVVMVKPNNYINVWTFVLLYILNFTQHSQIFLVIYPAQRFYEH